MNLASPTQFLKLRVSKKASGTNAANFLLFPYGMKAHDLLPEVFSFYTSLPHLIKIQEEIGEGREDKNKKIINLLKILIRTYHVLRTQNDKPILKKEF
jgi:hypothetical protein